MPVLFETIDIYKAWLPFVTPQPSWNGTLHGRDVVLIRAQGPSGVAWSELAALPDPTYDSEFLESELWVMVQYLLPASIGVAWQTPVQYFDWLDRQVVGHGFAKAALDFLGWSMHAQAQNLGLLSTFDAKRDTVKSGVVLRVDDWSNTGFEWVLESGYSRIKFKISADTSIQQLRQIRSEMPVDCLMVVDGNGRLNQEMLARLDFVDWVEEPLTPGDWVGYQRAMGQVDVPIVLDESIRSPMDAMMAAHFGCAFGMTLKPSRLGGATPTLRLASDLKKAGIRVGIGGMYETGIGRYYNLALDAAIQTELVGDFSPDSRYWAQSVMTIPNTLTHGVFYLRDGIPDVELSILNQNGVSVVASFG